MTRCWMSAVLLAGCLIGAASVHAGTITVTDLPDATGQVCFGNCQAEGEDLFRFSLGIDPQTGDIVPIGNGRFESVDGDVVVLGTAGNVDPALGLALSIVDFGAPTAFAISLTAPLIPTYSAGTLLASMATLSGTLIDAAIDGDGLVAMSALSASGMLMQSLVNGTPVSSIGAPVPSTSVGSGGSLAYGPFSATDTLVCTAGGCDMFGLTISFTGNGGGDRYELNGQFDLSEMQSVPVPGVLLLMALGLAVMPTRRWRDQGQSRLSSTPAVP